MSPLWILLIALCIVIGGVLVLRLHAFLTLLFAAFIVAALTSSATMYRFEIRNRSSHIVSINPDCSSVTVSDPKRRLEVGTIYDVYTLTGSDSPFKSAEVTVVSLGTDERPVATATVLQKQSELSPSIGDSVITTGAAIAARSASQETIGKRVAEGFGRTALDIGILIAMASILGSCLMAARGAERIVFSLQQAIGQQRTPLVFLLSGFVLGIPMFAEAVFYLLLPLAKAMWMKSRRHYLLLVLSIVAGATMTHSLVPPTPGPLFVADAMGIGLSLMMRQGLIVGLVAALSGYAYALWADARWSIPLRLSAGISSDSLSHNISMAEHEIKDKLPSLFFSLLPILLPVVLISTDSLIDSFSWDLPPWFVAAVHAVGDKNIALTLSAVCAIGLLVFQSSGNQRGTQVRKSIHDAVIEAGEIILVIAAGGALGSTLRQAGMSELASAFVPEATLLFLPMAWGITAIVRIAQGSATVAMITAVGIIAPIALAEDLSYHPVYVAIAIGCGSKVGMWMNDSGFWVISKLSGMNEMETLRTASAMVFIEGCVGLVVTLLLATLWPML